VLGPVPVLMPAPAREAVLAREEPLPVLVRVEQEPPLLPVQEEPLVEQEPVLVREERLAVRPPARDGHRRP